MNEISNFLEGVQRALKDYVFNLFSEPKVAIGLALLLLVVGILFVLWLVFFKWVPFSKRLIRLENVVRKTSGELGFVKDFATVDEAMQSVRVVRHGWDEFKETLVFPESESDAPIHNTSRPSNYINIAEAETSGLHIRFIQAVPNYFVGIGLLLTFLGLVAAIYFASQGISPGNPIAATQESLQKLLHAATFKFLTSIAGILSSLLVGICYRLVAGNLQKHFDNLCGALEQRLSFATAESIAMDQFRELQRQTVQLERFNTDLAFSIAKELNTQLTTSLPGAFEKALAPLAATMNNMADRFGEMNQDAMSSMLDSFTQNLQQSAGSEMEALGTSLAQTKDSLSTLVGALQTAGSQLNQTLHTAGQRMESAATGIEQSIKAGLTESSNQFQTQMSQVSNSFHDQFTSSSAKFSAAISGVSNRAEKLLEPMQQHLSSVSDRLEGLSAGLQQQIDSIAQLNTQLGSLVQHTGSASDRLQNAGEPVRRASEAIGLAATNISETSKATSQVQAGLTALAESMKRSVDETTRHWDGYSKRFEQVDKDLANTFKEFREGILAQQSAIREFVSGVDEEFGKALRNLGAGVEGLQDNLEDFTAAVETLGKNFGHA